MRVEDLKPPTICVLGGGIVGLMTARELRKRGYLVKITAAESPANTTSAGAGGFWEPFHCEPADLVEEWAKETLSFYLDEYLGRGSPLVEALAVVQLNDYNDQGELPTPPRWTSDPRLGFKDLTIVALEAAGGTHPLYCWRGSSRGGDGADGVQRIPMPEGWRRYPRAWLWHSVVVDAPRFLGELLATLERDPGVETYFGEAAFPSIQAAAAYAAASGCAALVNCSGLGSHALCGDGSMVAGRGGVAHYSRRRLREEQAAGTAGREGPPAWTAVVISESGHFASDSYPAYVIPRGDVYVVGGSYIEMPPPPPPLSPSPHPPPPLDVEEGRATPSSLAGAVDAKEVARLRRNAFALGGLLEQRGADSSAGQEPGLARGASSSAGGLGSRQVSTRR